MSMVIRPGNGDTVAIVDLINLVHPPAERVTMEEFRHQETLRSPNDAWNRLVVVEGNQLIALADVANSQLRPPEKFTLYIAVHPEFRRRGIGTELEGRQRAFARQHGGRVVTALIRENDPGSRRFLERLGYHEAYRRFEMELDVERFEWGRYPRWRDRLGKLRLFTLADAGPREDNLKKLYALSVMLGEDVPHPDGPPRYSFEVFKKWASGPGARDDAVFIVADGDRWVGTSGMVVPEGRPAHTFFTGVSREYRGRGLATVLKLAAIEYAKTHGVTAMRTTNDTVNHPMVAVNEKLGYRRLPARVAMRASW